VVLLDFAPLSWPHVSVANLIKQPKTTSATRELLVARELDVSSTGDGPGSADPGRAGPAEPAPAAGRLVVIPDDDDDDLDAPPAGAAPTKKVARATRKAPAKGRPPTR